MKLLSVAVPCYNSAAYMRRCIDSILTGGDRVEIIIVDDGSTKDNTLEIAKEYEAKYPDICKAVHQENGGHGEAVNTGLKNSTGVYFKVVDSDDRLDEKVLVKVLDKLEEFVYGPEKVDMFCCNFVYDKQGVERKKVMSYKTAFPIDQVFEWKDVKFFMLGQYLLMHSVIYRTELLKSCKLQLPKHTFYVDNIYVYYPLPYVKKIYYMNENLYRYFIGREDQSVSRKNIIARYKQQVGVTDIMIRCHRYADLEKLTPRLKKYMKHDLNVLITLSVMFTTGGRGEDVKERKAELKRMWRSIKEEDVKMYRFLRYRCYIATVNWMPFSWQRFFTTIGYYYFSKKLNCS